MPITIISVVRKPASILSKSPLDLFIYIPPFMVMSIRKTDTYFYK